MQAAGKAERELAIQQNSYHQGVPAITVVVDDGWSKHTHKHIHNALSAVTVIFGQKTVKLLLIPECTKQVLFCLQKTPFKSA